MPYKMRGRPVRPAKPPKAPEPEPEPVEEPEPEPEPEVAEPEAADGDEV